MEEKNFLFKSRNILSVAILLASLTTFGSAEAQDIQITKSQALPTPIIKTYKEDYFGLIRRAKEIPKKKRILFPKVLQITKPKKIIENIVKPVTTQIKHNRIAKKVASEPKHKTVNVVATAYTSTCNGCGGITSTGINVRNTVYYEGARVIATDPSVIPTHSLVQVDTSSGQNFMAVAEDKGGAIHGGIIDVLVSSYSQAIGFGRQRATITILRVGA